MKNKATPAAPEREPGIAKGTIAWYADAFARMGFDKGFEEKISHAANLVLKGKGRYLYVAGLIGCPWWFVGVLHNMEASCSFAGVLHNGERILGKGVKTSLVPVGRGPFDSWESAAVDALLIKGFQNVTDWSIPNILRLAENYNGRGYLNHHPSENSPYLWACTTINDDNGKYVADGKWSETAPTNGQVGVAALIKELQILGEIA